MNFINFLISRTFIKNLLIALGTLLGIVLLIMIWLNIYTHHGEALSVPDLTGLNEGEAKIVTDSKKLRFVIADSVFYNNLPKGTVVKQNPDPGSMVKENRTIYLTMNAMSPEKVIVPRVTGVSDRQARAILETHGLTLGKISYRPDIAINVVLQQLYKGNVIESGEIIIKGSSIDLVLGNGLSNETTQVPALVGSGLISAKNLLADRYLNIGATIYDNTVLSPQDTMSSFIWRQAPEFHDGSRLQLGSNVDVWLTTDSLKLSAADSVKVVTN